MAHLERVFAISVNVIHFMRFKLAGSLITDVTPQGKTCVFFRPFGQRLLSLLIVVIPGQFVNLLSAHIDWVSERKGIPSTFFFISEENISVMSLLHCHAISIF